MIEKTPYISETIDPIIQRIMRVEKILPGKPNENVIVTYEGWIVREDITAEYDDLAEKLRPLGITPLFRWHEKKHAIVLIPLLPEGKPGNPLINLALLVLTILSVLEAGAEYSLTTANLPDLSSLTNILHFLGTGWPYAVSLMAILLAHEFGHYLVGRMHKAKVSLPYFIPLPFLGIGTMGAFINMKEPPKNRKTLLDIGVAGPLAGLAISIPVLIIGLSISHLDVIPQTMPAGTGMMVEGNSILYLLSKFLVFGKLLPAPESYAGVNPVYYWVRYFFASLPLPNGATDVMLSSVAWAGWVGMLVTALNLLPAGQLDGGHLLYVLFGTERAQKILPFILVTLVGLGFFWNGWWLWAMLIVMFGRFYAEPLDQITPLDSKRKALAVFALIIFILVFTPCPTSSIMAASIN